MGTFETNEIDTDNIAQNFNDSPDNIATSDELTPKECFFSQEDTSYAKKKRNDALLLKAGAVLMTSATALFGGYMITSAFLPELPSIENVSQAISNNSIHYSFEIKNKNRYTLTYIVQINHEDFENNVVSIEKEGIVEGIMPIPSYSEEMVITSLFKAAMLDYTKTVKESVIQGGKRNA